jgi:peptidoglycan/xylan/chitin deacetylase (PgdA/CDA1 family)
MQIKNFLFHRVSPQQDKLWPPMHPRQFEDIIRFLLKKYAVCSLEEMAEKGFKVADSKPVATVLFDDGYKDNIDYAVPILKKYQCPASFYVVTGCIDNNIPTWTYIVDHLLQNSHVQSMEFNMDFVSTSFQKIDCNTQGKRLELGATLKPWMKSLSNHDREEMLAALTRTMNDVPVPRNLMLKWEEIRQMKDAGFSIGSHSVSHPLLATIKDNKELSYELIESGNRIRKELGQFPSTISYPVGSFDERVISEAKKAGYKMGLAVEQKFFNTEKDNLFAIPRVELYNEPMWKSRMRISGLYAWIRKRIK